MKHLQPGALALAIGAATLAAGLAQAATPAPSGYAATLTAMNTGVTHAKASGEARFHVEGDTLAIDITMHGTPADTVHWQHFHGFVDGKAASCPGADADANGDGVVDLIETEKAAGTTMVPFDSAPAGMDVAHGTYPRADAEGAYHYHAKVSLKALDAAFAKAFPGQAPNLDTRVVFIHGVPAATALPSTVSSLGPIPAQTTLPIACGVIHAGK